MVEGVAHEGAVLLSDALRMAEELLGELNSRRDVIARLREEIADLENKVEELECVNEGFADDVVRVRKLAERVLGREDLDEDLSRYDLRRAVEDLARAVSA